MNQQQLDTLPTNILIDGNAETREVYINGTRLNPETSQAIRNHSPDGFNWGYGGSGPAQLALAILLKFMGVENASRYYQDFKSKVVSTWPAGEAFVVRLNLKEAIEAIMQHRKAEVA